MSVDSGLGTDTIFSNDNLLDILISAQSGELDQVQLVYTPCPYPLNYQVVQFQTWHPPPVTVNHMEIEIEDLCSDLPYLGDNVNYDLMQSVLAEGTNKQVLIHSYLSCHHHLNCL